jgi:hypothetical protein
LVWSSCDALLLEIPEVAEALLDLGHFFGAVGRVAVTRDIYDIRGVL